MKRLSRILVPTFLQIFPNKEKVILSIVAGATIAKIREILNECVITKESKPELVRLMPNLMVAKRMGVGGFCLEKSLKRSDIVDKVIDLLVKWGSFYEVEEEDMDVVTALAGSSPAYVYAFAQALIDAAVREGMNRESAKKIVTSLLVGAGHMLEGKHPIVISDEVSSPAGTTISGLKALKKHRFEYAVWEAISNAVERSREL